MSRHGAGATVLALHSIGLDAHAFDALRAAFAPDWRITAFDQCGHGTRAHEATSSLERFVSDAAGALAACSPGPVHLLGHSMGGAVAALLASRMATEEPGRIATLTLVSSPPRGVPAFQERAAAVRAGGVESTVASTMSRWFGDVEAASDAGPRNYARSALRTMQAQGLSGAWEALAAFPGYSDIAASLPPTLCVAALDDLSTPPRAMRAIVDAFVQAGRNDAATLTTLASGGHMAPLFAKALLIDALRGHWLTHGVTSFRKY